MPLGDAMKPRSAPANTLWPFPFTPQDWEQTPPAVQGYVRTVRFRARSAPRPRRNPGSPSPPEFAPLPPAAVLRQSVQEVSPAHDHHQPRKAGGKPSHLGHRQVLLAPTTVQELRPARCTCGNTTFVLTTPYHTPQVLELPPITIDVTHWVLPQGWWRECGHWRKAHVAPAQATGYGPWCSALRGEVAGSYGNGRRMGQTFCASVLHVPSSLGAIQKVLDRVAQAIAPH